MTIRLSTPKAYRVIKPLATHQGCPIRDREEVIPMTFDQWMKAVDLFVWRLAGVSVHDLPDCPFRGWFDSDVKPATAARRALKRAGW